MPMQGGALHRSTSHAVIFMLDRPIYPHLVGFEWVPTFRYQAQRCRLDTTLNQNTPFSIVPYLGL